MNMFLCINIQNATKMHKNITFCYVKFAYVNYLLYFCAQF